MRKSMSEKSEWKGVETYFVYHICYGRTFVEDRRFHFEIVELSRQKDKKIRAVPSTLTS